MILTRYLAGLFLFVSLAQAAEAEVNTHSTLQQLLGQCIESRFAQGEVSKINEAFSLDVDCPALFEESLSNKALQQLDPPLDKTSSLNQLLDARFLLSKYQFPDNSQYSIADKAFLQQLKDESEFEVSPVELGLWDRFIEWLKQRYKSDEQVESDWSWLVDFLEHGDMPEWLSKTIYYASIGLIIVLALLIVINELRAARRGGRKKRSTSKNTGGEWQDGLATIEQLDWKSITRLPARQQPGAMLRYVIDQFIERDWITNNRSHTNREMWRELRREHADTAVQFDHAVNLAERSVYGDQQLDDTQLRELYETAQTLVTERGEKPA